jgi:hypothetical protein
MHLLLHFSLKIHFFISLKIHFLIEIFFFFIKSLPFSNQAGREERLEVERERERERALLAIFPNVGT